jgi:hypothetical protein
VEESKCDLRWGLVIGRLDAGDCGVDQTYPHKYMATEEALPDVALAPPCLFVVKEGWPVLSDQ